MHDITPPASPEADAPLESAHGVPPRRPQSLSSIRSARWARSLSALPVNKVKAKLGGTKAPANLARKLLFRRQDAAAGASSDSTTTTPPNSPRGIVDTEEHAATAAAVELGRGSCLMPWARELKGCTSPPQGTLVDIDVDISSGGAAPLSPLYRIVPPTGSAGTLRAKGRSYSSPFPLPSSPFDIVPAAPVEVSEPIPIETPNYFDEYLPRELRLRVLAFLVELHEAEHARTVATGKWSAVRAGLSRNRWVGSEKGIRELLKLGRVGPRLSLVYLVDCDRACVPLPGVEGLAESRSRRSAVGTSA